ncbi:putative phosphatidylinositol transfer protein SEC14 [Ixodes scapularis]
MRGDCLPPELQLIAETELGETEDGKIESLDKLNQLLDEEPDLHSRRDDEFLLRFLRVRKYNVDTAQKKVKEYYKTRKNFPCVFKNFVPSNVKLDVRNMMMVFPQPDIHGRPVVLLKAGAWNPQTTSYGEALQGLTLIMEHLIADPVVQTKGVTCIHDFGGFTADKVLSINFGLLKMSLRLFLDCVPARIKATHIVNESYTFDMAYAMVRPFISKKMADRLHVHGANTEGLHKEVPVDSLPKEYGGVGPDLDFEAFWNRLEQEEEFFVENNRYGYTGKESCDDEIEVTAF